jgi:hypothetical protein
VGVVLQCWLVGVVGDGLSLVSESPILIPALWAALIPPEIPSFALIASSSLALKVLPTLLVGYQVSYFYFSPCKPI